MSDRYEKDYTGECGVWDKEDNQGFDNWIDELNRLDYRIKELEKENKRMKIAFQRKYDYNIDDVVDEIYNWNG